MTTEIGTALERLTADRPPEGLAMFPAVVGGIPDVVTEYDDAIAALEHARAIVLRDPEQAQEASVLLAAAKKRVRLIKDDKDGPRRKVTDPLGVVVNFWNGLWKRPMDAWQSTSTILDTKVIEFAAAAERERLRAVNEAAAAAAAAQAVLNAQTEKLAAKAEKAGDLATADAIRANTPTVQARAVAEPLKLAGTSIRDYWSGRVDHFDQLVQAVAAGEQPLTLLLPNQSALDALADQSKQLLAIPGVTAVKTQGTVSRGKR